MRVLIPLFFVPLRESRGQLFWLGLDHVPAAEPACGTQGALDGSSRRTAGLGDSRETFPQNKGREVFPEEEGSVWQTTSCAPMPFPCGRPSGEAGRSLVLTRLPRVPPMWLLIWPRDTAFPHLASPPAHRLLEGSVHAYSSPWFPPDQQSGRWWTYMPFLFPCSPVSFPISTFT